MTISSVYNMAASGLSAAVVRQIAAARNSSNGLTADSRRLIVAESEIPSGGVKAEARLSEESSDPIADAMDRLVSLYTFKANVVSLRTADKMVGTILDVRA